MCMFLNGSTFKSCVILLGRVIHMLILLKSLYIHCLCFHWSFCFCLCLFLSLSLPFSLCLSVLYVSLCVCLCLSFSPPPPPFPVFYQHCVVIDFGWHKMNIVMFPEMDNQCLLWIWRQCLMSTPSCPTFCSECSVCHFCVSVVINLLALMFCFGRSLPHSKRINQFTVCAFYQWNSLHFSLV